MGRSPFSPGGRRGRRRGSAGGVRLLALALLAVGSALGQAQRGEFPEGLDPTKPAEGQPAAGQGPSGTVTNIFFDTDLRRALSDVATQTGVVIIPDETVRGVVTMEFKAVPLEKALDYLLLAGGYLWEQIEPGVYFVTGPDPTSAGFRRIARVQIVPVAHTTPSAVAALLPEAYQGMVRVDDPGGRLILTAPRQLLAQLAELIQALDQPTGRPAAAITTATVPLVHLTTEQLATLLGDGYRTVARYDPAGNRVILTGSAEQVSEAQTRIRTLDTPTRETRLVALERLSGAGLALLLPESCRPYVKIDEAGNRAVVDAPSQIVERIVAQIHELDGAAQASPLVVQVVDLNYIQAKELQGLLPDSLKNAVKVDEAGKCAVVMGPPQLCEQAAAYIKAVDLPPLQIMIEALVIESTAGTLDQLRARAQSKHWGVDPGQGLMTYVDEAAAVLYELLALVEQNKATVKASPRVVAQEGSEAKVEVSTEQYFRIVTVRQNYDYVELQTIEAPIGLTITPRVAREDGMVTCQISPVVSDVTGTGADNLPIITKRTATTTVRVRDGEPIAIGGLLEELERRTTARIPLLGDIPIIGRLFQSTRTEKTGREVTIFVVPHVLDEEGRFQGPLLTERFGLPRPMLGPPPEPTVPPSAPEPSPPARDSREPWWRNVRH